MALYVSGGPPHPAGLGWSARRAARRRDRDNHILGLELRDTWRWTAEGTPVARVSPCVAGGVVVSVPEVVAVDLGPPVTLRVRLLAGQLVEDLAAAAPRLAEGMGVAAVRVERDRYFGYVRVTLLAADPLTAARRTTSTTGLACTTLLGHDEAGRTVELDWTTAAHVVVQGATRSGKTTGLYSALGQLAAAPHVQVTGCDPTGLLLAPWRRRRALVAPSVGTGNPAAHVGALEALTAEMDARIAGIPPGRDTVELGPGCPLLVVVLEEWPGLLRVLDADRQLGKLARAAVARLLGEGAKAGVRVVLVAQRAEANIIGGYERGQASHTLSYRVAGRDSVAMLHPDAPADVVAAHATAAPGVALLSAPGEPLRRLRAPHVSYADYCTTVTAERPA